MSRSFHSCDRDQQLLIPPSLGDWLPEGDIAYFLLDAVAAMDLRPFPARYQDGSGQKAYPPEIMLPLMLLAYCQGVRSSRQIERLCQRDIGFRLMACQTFPDHTTIARFRQKFRIEVQDLFVRVLELCRDAGLLQLGSVAIDGTKMDANAAMEANANRQKIAKQVEAMLDDAEQTDQAEDKQFGSSKRGDELPEALRSPASRRAALRAARERQKRLEKAREKAEAKARQLAEEYEKKVERQKEREEKTGRKATESEQPKPPAPEKLDAIKVNTTDPDSSTVKGRSGFLQGYNAQAAVTAGTQIIVAVDVTPTGCDTNQLPGMVEQVVENVEKVCGKGAKIGAILADAGYWSHEALKKSQGCLEEKFEAERRPELLVAVPPRYAKVKEPPTEDSPPPEEASLVERLEHLQRSPRGQELYAERARSVEPVFGQTKSSRGCDGFMQRGLENVRAEWTLMCTTHNLLKLWRHKMGELN